MRLALAATIALLTLDQAVSHEHWINLEKLHDPVTKVWCCDETDCFAQPAGEVTPAPGGYSIKKTGELFPASRVLWRSPDGKWWRCGFAKTRCLIGPPTSF